MRENIKAIKWCGCFSLIFLVITYAVSVNSEGHYIVLNSAWLSNSFLLTLFGGLFTSMLVVTLCEIQKYLSAKEKAEQYLFYHSFYLYQLLKQLHLNVEDYFNNQEWPVPENLLDDTIQRVQIELTILQMTDYTTFKHSEDTLVVKHRKFRTDTLPKIQPVLQSGNRLKSAINKTQMDEIQRAQADHMCFASSKLVTSASQRVSQVLKNEKDILSSCIAIMDDYLGVIDAHCKSRFKWDELKERFIIPHLSEFSEKCP